MIKNFTLSCLVAGTIGFTGTARGVVSALDWDRKPWSVPGAQEDGSVGPLPGAMSIKQQPAPRQFPSQKPQPKPQPAPGLQPGAQPGGTPKPPVTRPS